MRAMAISPRRPDRASARPESGEMPEVKFCKADVDEERDLAIEHGIESIPTLLIFRGGEIAGKLVGYRDKQSLRAEIEEKL